LNIQQYIASGIIEGYVLGLASPEEVSQLERLLPFYPELREALSDFEFQLELFALQNEIPPPPDTFSSIQDRLRKLPAMRRPARPNEGGSGNKGGDEYLHVREKTSHIRVHKYWRIAFIVVFILSKVFLFGLIYYHLQYKLVERDLRALQEQVKIYKANSFPRSQNSDK
jgi:hypothetical protein